MDCALNWIQEFKKILFVWCWAVILHTAWIPFGECMEVCVQGGLLLKSPPETLNPHNLLLHTQTYVTVSSLVNAASTLIVLLCFGEYLPLLVYMLHEW